MSEAHVEAVVQSVSAVAAEVARRVASGALASPDVGPMEKDVWTGALEIGRSIMGEVVASLGSGDVGPVLDLPEPDGAMKRYTRRALETGVLRTTMGIVEFERWRYVAADGDVVRPLDAVLGLSQKEVTPFHQEEIVRLVEKQAFREVRDDVEARSQVSMSVRTLEEIASYRASDAPTFEQEVPAPEVAAAENIVVVNLDRKGIPMKKDRGAVARRKRLKPGEKANKRKMSLVAVIYEVAPYALSAEEIARNDRGEGAKRNTRPKVMNKRVISDLKDDEWVCREVRRDLEARLKNGAQLVVGVDGEVSLRNLVFEHLGDFSALLLIDWWHVSEYLWAAALILGKKDPDAWYKKQALRILNGDVATVLRGMRQSITKRRGHVPRAVEKAINYLEKRKHFLDYAEAIEIGAPIGTGAVEGSCGHIIGTRMERPGMRWSVPGAQSILHLRCIAASGQQRSHHEWFRQRELQRLYPWKSTVVELMNTRKEAA
jgi:hypothetical protein